MKTASITNADDASGRRLSRLLRDGVIRPRRSNPVKALFSSQPPRIRKRASAVDALTRERRDGR